MARRGPIARLYDAVIHAGKAAMAALRAPTGEAAVARMVGTYGAAGFGGTPLSKAEQILHFRGWTYRCVDYICGRLAKEPPCAVRAAGSREAEAYKLAQKAFLLGKGAAPEPRAWANHLWKTKSLGPTRPDEEYEFLDDSHPLVRLLRDPNDPETGVSVWYEAELFNCLTGEDFLWVVEGDSGRPDELWVIPSHWVRPICLGNERLVDYFEVTPRGNAPLVRFAPEEVIWHKRPSPLSKLVGAGPLQAQATTIDSYEMTEAARYFSLQNGAAVGGTIKVPPTTQLTQEQINRLESRFLAKYGGVKNVNRPIILEGGTEYVPAPAEAELAFMSSMDQLRKYVMAGWGLDEVVLGFASVSNRAAMVAAIANVNEATVNPRRRSRAAVLTEKLARRFDERLRVLYPDDTPLDPDSVRTDFASGGSLNAVSPNDYRTRVLGLEPWPEPIYDRPLVSPGLMNPGSDQGDWDGDGQPGATVDDGGNDQGGAALDPTETDDPFAGLVDDAALKTLSAITGRWFTKHGPPPFPGAVFDEGKHRWVRGSDADAGGAAARTPEDEHFEQLAEHLPPEVHETPGVWDRVKGATKQVATAAYERLVRATPAMMKAMAVAEAIFDTPDDMKKHFGYAPAMSAQTASGEASARMDPLKNFLTANLGVGVSTHLACTIASHVLAKGIVWAKKKLREGKAAGDGFAEAGEWVAGVFAAVNDALGMEGAPSAEEVADRLRALAAGSAKAWGRKAHGPPPFPGAVFDESRHRWVKPHADAPAQRHAARREPRTAPDPPPERFAKTEGGRVLVGADVQRWCEGTNEPAVAHAVGGKSLPDNEPMDVVVPPPPDAPSHGIELKTMVANEHRKIHMKSEAQARKRAWRRKNKVPVHTVVIDDTAVYNAKGPGQHDLSKRRVFYRRGFGSFKVDGMFEVEGGFAALPKLMATPTRSLPPGAWKPVKKAVDRTAARKLTMDEYAEIGAKPRSMNDVADRVLAPPDEAATKAVAGWVAAATGLPPETAARYNENMALVLSNMPAGSRAAVESLPPARVKFHAGVGPLTEAYHAIKGQRPRGLAGFVHERDGGPPTVHIDGGPDTDPAAQYEAKGTYAHELAHVVDANARYSGSKDWKAAYQAEIVKGKTSLGTYALESPAEGFAELYRAMHEKGPAFVAAAFPKCHKYLAKQGLL